MLRMLNFKWGWGAAGAREGNRKCMGLERDKNCCQ